MRRVGGAEPGLSPDLALVDDALRAWLSLTPRERLSRSWALRRRLKDPGAAHDAKIFDQRSVRLAEGSVAVVGNHLYVVHAVGAAPTFLREGKIHADAVDLHVG